jgi:glycosyltransferase involved in cell wall biosynthesis
MYSYFFDSARVVLLSNYLYDDVKSFVSKDQIFILANGSKDFLPSAQKSFHKSVNGTLQIGYLSNLIVSKGILILLDVLKRLDKNGYNFNCTIAGIESELTANSLNVEIKTRELNDKVKFIGAVQGESKAHFFNSLDVFVLPTNYPLECMPLVLIEAASVGLPIISSLIGGIPDIVNNSNGFLIEVDDLENGVYNALCQLYEYPELIESLGLNSRRIYEQRFTEERFNNNVFDILTL